ncbi:hemolysin family protein [Methylomarinum sp. Ch1-1]|uniref:Hemolysin family protein n=1 Tax=Methylomarinum roseum TaxID=3067653 RepID=A0AAU7NRA8_9GAMM|nr:hemolysin family protein [Methylomarinum sp. Ch1-1]MDP4520541.1 hemolysin family protein [Methylomarinum sp. Ch1-1]
MELYLDQLALLWQQFLSFVTPNSAKLNEPELIVRMLMQLLLLMGSAVFSSSETALFSLTRLDLQTLHNQNHPQSSTLHTLLEQPRRLIISILCGNELINIAAAANMTVILIELYGESKAGWFTLFVMVPLLLVFGEVTPKTIAVSNPVEVSTRIVIPVIRNWIKLVAPLRWLVWKVSDRVTTFLVGQEKSPDNILHVDEFRTLVDDVVKTGQLGSNQKLMIFNLLEAGATEVVEIMIPRTKMPFINGKWPVDKVTNYFRQHKQYRIPVFKNHHDNLLGFVHADDVASLLLEPEKQDTTELADLIHPPIVVPLTKKVDEMFDFFKLNNARAAVILNEFGGVEGMVTLEGVLEFVFGEICPKTEMPGVIHEANTEIYDVPGDMKLIDFEDLTNFVITDARMTTIAGVLFRRLDRLPKTGDRVQLDDYWLTVLEMDGHRIARVRVSRGEESNAAFNNEYKEGEQ